MSEKTILNVEGMTCNNCALGVTRMLEKKGLRNVIVDFASGEVIFDEIGSAQLPEIKKGIHQLGYQVIDLENSSTNEHQGKFNSLELRFAICAIFTLPLLLHMFSDLPLFHNPFFQLILSTPVYLIGLYYFGRSALSSLKAGVPNMDVLVITGATAAYFYSIAGVINFAGTTAVHNFLFFETTATIITLVMLGNIIEKRSVKKTTSALRELAAMQPANASKIIINKDFTERIQIIPVSELIKNDIILINTGDAIPVDGKIYWGAITVDESALTGESIPAEKEIGSIVLAGSIVLSGSAKAITEKAGKLTALAKIIELVKDAQQSKPEIQKLGDKISAWFVPVVVSIAILTFFISFYAFDISMSKSIMSAVAVLVISCPCAMGLATPTAVAVGIGKAAKEGILMKGGSTLELFSNIKTAVFDKTGTLTTGKFKIGALNNYGITQQEAYNLVYSIEQHSSHPIARSLVKELEKLKTEWITFDETEEQKGLGIKVTASNGDILMLGSYNSHKHLTTENNHSVYLSRNNKLIATIDLTDEVRNGANEMIQTLKSRGIKTVLLSGDNVKRCEEIARFLQIEEVYAGKMPDEKSQIVNELKKRGRLMMVGDGINDAPSLEYADIGISFGEATKIAINSAKIVILNSSDLRVILRALKIGQMTLQTIKQNLFWAFAYNIVAIPVAAMGYLSPMVAAFSMAFSDVIVIGNSIRLKFRKSH